MKQRYKSKRKSITKLSLRDKQTSLLQFFSRGRDEDSNTKQTKKKKHLTKALCMDVSSPCSLSKIGILDSNNNSNHEVYGVEKSSRKNLSSSFHFGPVNENDEKVDNIDKKRQILEGNLRLKDIKNYKQSLVPDSSALKGKNNNNIHLPKDSLAQIENHRRTDSLGNCFYNTKQFDSESTSSISNNSDFPKDSLARSSGLKTIEQESKPNYKTSSDYEDDEQCSSVSTLDNNDSPKDSLVTLSHMKNISSSSSSDDDSPKDSLANLSRISDKDSLTVPFKFQGSSKKGEPASLEKKKSKHIETKETNSTRDVISDNSSFTSQQQVQQDEDDWNIISNDDEDDDNGNRELSEYEKLRLRNIARNEARMVALGLTVLPKEKPKKPTTKRVPKKIPFSGKNSLSKLPTRRSTRVRNKELLENNPTNVEDIVIPETNIIMEEEKPEEYTVSPLVQYNMMDQNSSSQEIAMSFVDDRISLRPCRDLCLRPPSRLDAIYSLSFCPYHDSLLVGAGKAGIVALWNLEKDDPIMTWKAHSGRWIATAQFVDTSKLLTAGNDGCVCLWDLTSTNVKTETPKMLVKTNKVLHQSGIFSMHWMDQVVATASKDKSIAITSLESLDREPMWRSTFHSSKVSSVCLQNQLVASSSDDGTVAIHDYRCSNLVPPIVLEDAHIRPHSAIWNPSNSHTLLTAGLDDVLKLWDCRNIRSPVLSFRGHVPLGTRMKKIQRPVFYQKKFILTGGERSGSLSMFRSSKDELLVRGSLPDGSDVGSLACNRDRVAVSLQGGEILLLHLSAQS